MKFKKFAQKLQKIEDTSSRNEMTDIIVEVIKSLSHEELKKVFYLIQGRVVPRYFPLEFNVARKLMTRSLSDAYAKSVEDIQKLFSTIGDLGLLAEKLSKRKRCSLSILDVYQHLSQVASLEGKDSQLGKIKKISTLLKLCDPLSGKFVTRMILGKMRLGVSDKSILDALSIYVVGDKSYRKVLDRAYGIRGDIGYIAHRVATKGIDALKKMKVQCGVPVASMLCERESSVESIFKRMDAFVLQPKYDGLRCQIHYRKKGFKKGVVSVGIKRSMMKELSEQVRIFSRNQENLTEMFPDIIKAIFSLRVSSIVVDSEAVGINPKTGELAPFQKTIQRRRKHNIKETSQNVPIRAFVFDILLLDDRDLTAKTLKERVAILDDVMRGSKSQKTVVKAPSLIINNMKSFDDAFSRLVLEGLEGVIVKGVDSIYEPGKRGYDWIKVKKSQRGHLIDTIDAVVLGYYRGRGARARFGIGAILVGVYNKKDRSFETIAKVGTGIKDNEWKKIKITLDKNSIKKVPDDVSVKKNLVPDIWVKPSIITVVEADEMTKSPNHTAGSDGKRGYSLRFPRLKEFDRKDKTVDDATTVEEVKNIFKSQKK